MKKINKFCGESLHISLKILLTIPQNGASHVSASAIFRFYEYKTDTFIRLPTAIRRAIFFFR